MNNPQNTRILAIAPSACGIGFAVLEGGTKLVDWGTKAANGDKNAKSLADTADLLNHFLPQAVVLEDASAKGSRRHPRIRKLSLLIATLAAKHKVRIRFLSREKVKKTFLPDGLGTKHDIAEIIAKRFPEELADRLPPKRKLWNSEDCRMDIFDAVALALASK